MNGVTATALAMTEVVNSESVIGYFTIGVVGSLMPDIDSKSSIPIRLAYQIVSALASLLLVLHLARDYSLVELMIIGFIMYFVTRFVVFKAFSDFTVHRGLVHSIPGAAAFGLATGLVAHYGFGASDFAAWLASSFMALGFLVHLTMDELYSVDLLGQKIKRSFGSAVKFGDRSNLVGTVALYVIVGLLFSVSPSSENMVSFASDPQTYAVVFERLFPDGNWFEG